MVALALSPVSPRPVTHKMCSLEPDKRKHLICSVLAHCTAAARQVQRSSGRMLWILGSIAAQLLTSPAAVSALTFSACPLPSEATDATTGMYPSATSVCGARRGRAARTGVACCAVLRCGWVQGSGCGAVKARRAGWPLCTGLSTRGWVSHK